MVAGGRGGRREGSCAGLSTFEAPGTAPAGLHVRHVHQGRHPRPPPCPAPTQAGGMYCFTSV